MDAPIVAEWLQRLQNASDEGDDLIGLGRLACADERLSNAEFYGLVRNLSTRLLAFQVVNFLEVCVGRRPVPELKYWQDIILASKDPGLGMKLLSLLMPFIKVTDLIRGLLQSAHSSRPDQLSRIANTVWYATSGVSLSLSTGDRFAMREALEERDLIGELQKALPVFKDPQDRRAIESALSKLTHKS